MMKKLIPSIILFFMLANLSAQQEKRFSMYMFNLYQVNSAYTGSRDAINLAAIIRTQWAGMEGAPIMQNFTANMPIPGKNFGVGIKIKNQSAGASAQTKVMASFAYHLRVSKNGKLSFGMSAGMLNNRFYWGKANFKEQEDQMQTSGTENAFTAGMDFAIYYYTHTWYAGVQAENLNQSKYQITEGSKSINVISYTAIAGKAFPVNKKIVLKPSLLLRGTKGAFLAEFNFSMLYNEYLWAGLTYRTNNELSIILEVNISHKFRIGYSFDYAMSPIQTQFAGSHEVFIGYDIPVKKQMVSARYF